MLQVPRNVKDILIEAEVAADSASRRVNECFEDLNRARKAHEEAKTRANYWKRLVDLEANSHVMVIKERDEQTSVDSTQTD